MPQILDVKFDFSSNKTRTACRITIFQQKRPTGFPFEFPYVQTVSGVKVMIAATIDPFPFQFIHVAFVITDGLA
jgi:hypothetical protein